MMLAARTRNRPRARACLPQLEQLEDRRVFNASWHSQLAVPTVQFTEVVVQWVPAPPAAKVAPGQLNSDLNGHSPDRGNDAGRGIGNDGGRGIDLAALLLQPQSNGGEVGGQDGNDGGDNGGNGNAGSTGVPTSGGTGDLGGPGNTGGAGRGGKDDGSGQGTGAGTTPNPVTAPTQGVPSTPVQSAEVTAETVPGPSVSSLAEHGSGGNANPVASLGPATTAANPQAVAAAAVLAAEATAAAAEASPDVHVVPHPELVARADLHPATGATVLNAPSSYSSNTVRIDSLPGGKEPPAFAPQPTDPNAVPPSAQAPAKGATPRPDGGGAQDKADTGAEPQEAGLLTKVPLAAVPPLGLQQALRRLKDLLADLTTSRALLHALPLTGAAIALGGAAFGLVRWRRKKRLTKKDVPDGAPEEGAKDTWLPGSGSLPPVDPA